jgi:hypothetical protein
LKAEAEENTVARNEGRLQPQSMRKQENKAEEPSSKYSNSPKKDSIRQITYITPPTKTPE